MKIPTPKEILWDKPIKALKAVVTSPAPEPLSPQEILEAIGASGKYAARTAVETALGVKDMTLNPMRNLINATGSDIITAPIRLFSEKKANIIGRKVRGPITKLFKPEERQRPFQSMIDGIQRQNDAHIVAKKKFLEAKDQDPDSMDE